MSLPSLDLEVLFATLIGQIPNDTPAEYQQCIRVVMSSFTDCATHQGPKRNHFTPKSEAVESRSKNSTVQGITHCKVTYQDLAKTLSTLATNKRMLTHLQNIFFEFQHNELYFDLNSLDSPGFKQKLAQALLEVDRMAPGNPNYALMLKATFALKFYLEQTRLKHPLPLKGAATLNEAREDFRALKEQSAEIIPQRGEDLGSSSRWQQGRKACDFFMASEREKCRKALKEPFSKLLRSPGIAKKIIGYLHCGSSNQSFVKSIYSDHVPTDFKPAYIKHFIHTMEQQHQMTIESCFDPCGGWSGRLIGAMAVPTVKYYKETDPNTALHDKKIDIALHYNEEEHKELIVSHEQTIGVRSGEKEYIMLQKPVEDLTNHQLSIDGTRRYDLVLYSPPYFDLERYPDSEQQKVQSYERYPTLNAWLKGFLYRSIEQSYTALRNGGIFAINIAPAGTHDLPRYVQQYMSLNNFRLIEMPTYHYSLLKSFPSYVYVYKKSAPLLPPVMSKVPLLTNCNDEESLNNEKSSRDALPPTKRFKTMNERPYLYGLSPQTQALVNHSVFAEQDGSKGRKALFSSKVMSEQPPVSSKESHRRTIQ